MEEYLLKTNGLTKKFKKQVAVNQVNIHIKQGDIYGFIGRNGAGKTTFLKMISGLSTPTSGEITLFGYTGKERLSVLSRVGALIEQPGLYMNMSARENLTLKCICAGIKREKYIENLLGLVGLSNTANKKVKNFSLGMKQRLGIALALVGEPDLLVLDEPINGLDPQGIVEIRDMILRLNKEYNTTILISSHILEELSKIATRYGIIHQGILLEELSKEELLFKCSERIEIMVDNTKLACVVLDEMGFSNYKVIDQATIYVYERLDESNEITMELVKRKIKIRSIVVNNEELENYYLDLTGGTMHD